MYVHVCVCGSVLSCACNSQTVSFLGPNTALESEMQRSATILQLAHGPDDTIVSFSTVSLSTLPL